MVQFCIMYLSLPPIPNILRATLPGITRFLQYTDFSACSFRLHPPPLPPLLEKVWLNAVTVSRKRLNKGGVGQTVILTEGEVALFS